MGRHVGGRFGFHSCPAIFGAIGKSRKWSYVGSLGILIPIIIYMYYVVIESWCLSYAMQYLFGTIDLGSDPSAYADKSKELFGNTVGIGADGFMQDGALHSSMYWWVLVFGINLYLIYHGLTRGIERFCKIAMPIMALCAIIVLVRVLTLGTPNPEFPERTVLNGLGFMWNPKAAAGDASWTSVMLNPQTWIAATGQIFFSLSVGFGIIVNYSSYMRRKDDVVLTGLTASSTNEFFEVCLGGLITIPAAFVFLGASGAIGGTFGARL